MVCERHKMIDEALKDETKWNARKLTYDATMSQMGRCNVLACCVIVLGTLMIPVVDAVYSGLKPSVIAMASPSVATTTSSPSKKSLQCEYFDPYVCSTKPHTCNKTQVQCNQTSSSSEMHCYVLWNITSTGASIVVKKGCWQSSEECFEHEQCVDKRPKRELYFCCCVGNLCNKHFAHRPEPVTHTTVSPPRAISRQEPLLTTLVYSLIPIMVISLIVPVAFWLWRSRNAAYRHAPTQDPELPVCVESIQVEPLCPIQLLEIKARGRFGCVWKAQMGTAGLVAVKVFPPHDRQSWVVERDFYSMPLVSLQPTILQFVAAELRGEGATAELWLITQFHERGSLHDHLKSGLLSWPQLLSIALSVAQGLAFLHEDGPVMAPGMPRKVAVAHRDVKSKNVLVKSDLSACIADFGLAISFEMGKSIGDVHGQVGTRRYMAPEVLEGAINFTRDAFLRIDMYACGLLLWELVSRCSVVDGPVDEYRLPYEDEVSLHPSLEDMQELVVHKKMRPQIKEHWLKNPAVQSICETIEECWDHDPEARLAAGCVKERLVQMTAATTDTVDEQQVALLPPPAKESSI